MNAVIDFARLPRELGGWGLRGALCAGTSFFWALVAGFNDPVEIAGMAAGIVVWVALFAGFCVWHGQSARRGPDRLVPALKAAAWIKAGLSAAGWSVCAICWMLQDDSIMVGAGVFAVMPDCLIGAAAVALVAKLSGVDRFEALDSFGWTTLTTVIDGALFVFVIAGLTLAVLAWWRFGPRLLASLRFSPACFAG